MEKRWNIIQAESMSVDSLFQSLKIHPIICKILVQRGLDSYEKTKRFFRPVLEDLHDPFLMKDMDKATNRIFQAIREKE
jgi:single-stranded-DNA-specific exonuclease